MPNKFHLIESFTPRRPWFALVNRQTLRDDTIAGLTNAAIVLPQGVAFAVIAGLPPEYGLYTAMITPVIAALWGMSMIMVSGPTTAISAVMFAALSELAPPGTPLYIQFALTLTIIAGLFQLLAGIFRLGGMISFISHSVMVGFTAAAALLIGASQLGGAIGVKVESGGGVIERVARVSEHIGDFQPLALVLALSSLATIVIAQRLSRKIPAYLLALLVGVGMGALTGASSAGIEMFDKLPSLLPSFSPPTVALADLPALLPGAVSVGFVGLLEAISIGRAFAMRRRERYNANQEIIGQGLSNVAAGFFQAYAGSGSFTRSAMNAEAGARTPLSAIFAAGWLILLLFIVAPFVDHIPKPAMAGIIVYVAWRLINFAEIRHIVRSSQSETLILTLTFLAGIATELENAIFVGVIASLAVFLYRSSHPHIAVLAPISRHGRRLLRGVLFHDLEPCPQVNILRLDGPLFFGSVDHVESEFRRFEAQFPEQRFKILVLKGLGKIDLAGVDLLVDEITKARKAGGDYHLVVPFKETVDALERMKLFETLPKSNLHPNKSEAIQAVTRQLEDGICRTCRIRAFVECAAKPAPTGIAAQKDAPIREGEW